MGLLYCDLKRAESGGALLEYAAIVGLFALLLLTGLPKINTALKQLDSSLQATYTNCEGYPYPPSLVGTLTCQQQLQFFEMDVMMYMNPNGSGHGLGANP